MLEILLFLLLGFAAGMATGIIPGIHPNTVVLFVPVVAFIGSINLLVFVVSMAVANTIADFIPSILVGAPEEGSELSVQPGHMMLFSGCGYDAIKLCVLGGLFACVISIMLFPAVMIFMPAAYGMASPFIFVLLAAVSAYMILAEKRKLTAAAFFTMAALVGIFSPGLPLDNSLLLFPVLAGLFGVSSLAVQIRGNASVPEQKGSVQVSRKMIGRASILGTAGGIVAGFLPGVGTSQIASVFSQRGSIYSFLVSLGAISMANIIFSFISLWLIGKARSGAAVAISSVIDVSFSDVLLILAVALASASLAVAATLALSRRFMDRIAGINYQALGKIVIVFMVAMTGMLTGVFGLLLLVTCSCIGIAAKLSGVRMSILTSVLIVPAIIYYIP